MTDQSSPEETTHVPGPGTAIRKVLFTVGVLFVIWLIFVQIAPRYFIPHNTSQSLQPAPQASSTPPALPEKDEHIASLTDRINVLEARLKVMEDLLAGTPKPLTVEAQPPMPATSFVEQERVAGLEAKLGEQEVSLQAMQAQIQEAQSKADQQLAIMTAFLQLKEAIGRGEPFTPQLDQLKKLAHDNAAAEPLFAELAPRASKGSDTLAMLKESFEKTIPAALSPRGTWRDNLNSLIRVRKVGENQPGMDHQAIIARAEAQLAQGDLESTLKELSALTPPASDAFAGWVAQAQHYLETRRLVEVLQLVLAENQQAESQ